MKTLIAISPLSPYTTLFRSFQLHRAMAALASPTAVDSPPSDPQGQSNRPAGRLNEPAAFHHRQALASSGLVLPHQMPRRYAPWYLKPDPDHPPQRCTTPKARFHPCPSLGL